MASPSRSWRILMAAEMEVKEQTMRRREGSGEKEFSGVMRDIWAFMASREEGWKRDRSRRSVIRRVFEGGEG
ncbi:hypothetical protein EMCG_09225 [[Emmonsia] crescens]|uniref:Uncharacterized protein n=1 Tax=[Emmonsia] crescens TaxID=73230 RepID=A0A0G2I376_9EURO|nr:hypothetical protein EMCG_09225 [Emmonsia crescens UAMH 3008]